MNDIYISKQGIHNGYTVSRPRPNLLWMESRFCCSSWRGHLAADNAETIDIWTRSIAVFPGPECSADRCRRHEIASTAHRDTRCPRRYSGASRLRIPRGLQLPVLSARRLVQAQEQRGSVRGQVLLESGVSKLSRRSRALELGRGDHLLHYHPTLHLNIHCLHIRVGFRRTSAIKLQHHARTFCAVSCCAVGVLLARAGCSDSRLSLRPSPCLFPTVFRFTSLSLLVKLSLRLSDLFAPLSSLVH